MKTCNNKKCPNQNPQPLEDFFKDKNNKTDGRYSLCKTCKQERTLKHRAKRREEYNAYMREYRVTHPVKYETDRNKGLKLRYGITIQDYEEMLLNQGGTCALCDSKPGKRPLHVDHHHATGKVRGLLCSSHNRSIAILDNPELLEKGIKYVRKSA